MNTEKIEMLFQSNNLTNWKLAQKMCHGLRISYYVFIGYKCVYDKYSQITGIWAVAIPRYKRWPVRYSLYEETNRFYITYKIDLDGNTKRKNRGILPK